MTRHNAAGNFVTEGGRVNDDRLTDELARRVLGWRVSPGRFLTSGRSWEPRYRFEPLKQLEHAFRLLDRAATAYTLTVGKGGDIFTAEVTVEGRTGKATGPAKARTITLALAAAIGLEIPR